MFDLLKNIESCYVDLSSIFYYSHLTSLIVPILIGLFVFWGTRKSDRIKGNILLALSLSFSFWILLNLIVWISHSSLVITFFWSLFGLANYLIFFFSFYFFLVFTDSKDLKYKYKIVSLILFLPIVFFINKNILGFDIQACESIENSFYYAYVFFIQILFFVSTAVFFFFKIGKINLVLERKKIVYFFLFLSLFLISFFATGFFASLTYFFELEQYGLFGMTIFMAFLAYLIVRFKAFNIKLLATQALIWTMIILIGSQFFFIRTTINKILTAITLVIVSIVGLILIRSVKKVDQQRELLDIANKNQQSLLHFITHQVKGFMTKSRGIFSGILEGDYGDVNGKVREMVQYGLDSETKGVETVQNILHASDLKSGTVDFVKQEFDLTKLVKGIIDDAREKIKEKGLELEENISAKPIMFNGDEMKLKEVCKNLIDNSVLYTTHGKISIYLKQDSGKVRFSVKDTGFGLSDDDKKDLFTEGGRGKDSLTVNVDSTGYGLYIAKQIVKEHDGSIWAESDGRDKGSEFIVELPNK